MEYKNHTCQEGTAFIIETRTHQNLPMVIENIHLGLPEGWDIWFLHSEENFNYIDGICKKITPRTCHKVLLKKPIQSLNDYNELLLSKSLWNTFSKENLICFQVDTLINLKQKNRLKEICIYDYVGAPWSNGIRRRWPDLPELGGNGGFCFSKRSQRIKALSICAISKKKKEKPSEYINEDIWFSKAFNAIKAKLPSREVAQSLLVESSFSKSPFAVHKPWSYVSPTELKTLYTEIPKLKELHMGFIEPLQLISCRPTNDERIYGDDVRINLLNYARERMNANNVYFADQALQISHSYFPDDPKTLNLQAMLGFSIGAYEQALQFVEKALHQQPDFKKAQENRAIIKKHITKAEDKNNISRERFLLIHSLGQGFAIDLLNLAAHHLLSELLNRELVVFWGNNSCSDTQSNNNIYETLIEDKNNLSIKDIEKYQKDVFPEHWKTTSLNEFKYRTSWLDKNNNQRFCLSDIALFNKKESLIICTEQASIPLLQTWLSTNHQYKKMSLNEVFRSLLKKIFKPKKIYIEKADQLINSSFQQSNYIAIHLRAYDTDTGKKGAFPTNDNEKIISQIKQHPQKWKIFLITDDQQILKQMQQKFGSRIITFGDMIFKKSIQGYDSKTSLMNTHKNIVEMLIAQKSRHFYGSEYSHFDCCINFLRPENNNMTSNKLMFSYKNPPIK